MRIAGLVLTLAITGCGSRWLESDISSLRAEISAMEREIPPEDTRLWIPDGENAFPTFIEDYSPRLPDFVYHHIVGRMSKMTDEEMLKLAEPATDIEEIIQNPAKVRGQIFNIHGMIASVTAEKFAAKDVPDLKWIYSGAVFIGEQPILFHVIDKPDVMYLGNDSVDFTGIFVKILRYESKSGRMVTAPFFICKSVKKFY